MSLEIGSEELEALYAKWKAEAKKYNWIFQYQAEEFFKHVKPPSDETDSNE